MGYKFNPFTGSLDTVDSPNGVFEEVEINGDITLDDGGTYTTTLQTITPTANRTISLPDATGTVALVAGSSGQVVWNNAGANAGASTLTYDGSILTTSGRFINSYNATASAPAKVFTGTWFTGGNTTTTKPQVLIEPAGTTSNAWSPDGTGLGVNAASTFTGRLLDLQRNGTSRAIVTGEGNVGIGTTTPSIVTPYASVVDIRGTTADQNWGGAIRLASNNGTTVNSTLFASSTGLFLYNTLATNIVFGTNNAERARIDSSGRLLVGTSTSTASIGGTANLQVAGSARFTNGLASTIDVASIAQNATTAITLPKHGLYCIFIDSMNLSALFFATISGGGTGVRMVFSTNATDVVGGLTTEPAGGIYLRLWISGNQLQIKNVNAFVTPYYITPLVTGA